jgi:hypothetical protein
VSRQRQRVVVSVGTTICLVFAAFAPALLDNRREPSSVVLYLKRSIGAAQPFAMSRTLPSK